MEKRNLTIKEVRKLFEYPNVWDSRVIYLASKLSAFSGLRIGELLGLRGECVYGNHICIEKTYKRQCYYNFKTKNRFSILLVNAIKEELEDLTKINGNGFIFSENGGKTPISEYKIKKHFRNALDRIGINSEEMRIRGLAFHSLRHFFITAFKKYNVAERKIISVTTGKISLIDYYLPPENPCTEIMIKLD